MDGDAPRPVGIFGGTFDPIHYGHLRPALELCERLQMQRMLMIPSSVPPHRPQPVASPEQRLTMLRRAVEEEPLLQVDERELRRSGPSYMVDTLVSLRGELGETPLCLCLGVDAFLGLPGWDRWETLLELAHIIVAHRPGWGLEEDVLPAPLATLMARHGSDEEAALAAAPAGTVRLQTVTQLDISATAIRETITSRGSARYLLPEPVWGYIREQGLYR